MRLAQERTLCGFDFDGTLSPIVDRPDDAKMRERTRSLLRRLAQVYPCVVVSGRARADVLGKLNGVKVARVIGNHGAETEATEESRCLVSQWRAALEPELGLVQGAWDRRQGLFLGHPLPARQSKGGSAAQILAATRKLENARIFGGKAVVNLAPQSAPHKGVSGRRTRSIGVCLGFVCWRR